MIRIKRTNSNDPDFQSLVIELDKDLRSRYDQRQDFYDHFNKVPDLPTVIVAYEADEPVGCGCFKHFDDTTAEIKRMYVAPHKRGTGISTKILSQLEAWAKESGYRQTVLETGTSQPEAIYFYKREGYTLIPNYGQYIGVETSICMIKQLS